MAFSSVWSLQFCTGNHTLFLHLSSLQSKLYYHWCSFTSFQSYFHPITLHVKIKQTLALTKYNWSEQDVPFRKNQNPKTNSQLLEKITGSQLQISEALEETEQLFHLCQENKIPPFPTYANTHTQAPSSTKKWQNFSGEFFPSPQTIKSER